MSLVDQNAAATTTRRSGSRVVAYGLIAIVAVLLIAAVLLFMNLPDASAFNDRVEHIFVENNN